MRLIGIDPGARGAIALFVGGRFVEVRAMPTAIEQRKVRVDAAALGTMVREMRPDAAVVERVASMPRQGVASMFAFGQAYGIVLGALGALGIPVTMIGAAEWKGALRVPAAKGEARARASQLIPSGAVFWPLAKDDGKSEACLIALYQIKRSGPEIVW
jgi:crossover junction endodeoxyribonuclease RuvC